MKTIRQKTQTSFKKINFEVGPAKLWPWFRALGAKSTWEVCKGPIVAQAIGTKCLAPAAALAGKNKRPKKKGATSNVAPRSRWLAASKRRMQPSRPLEALRALEALDDLIMPLRAL